MKWLLVALCLAAAGCFEHLLVGPEPDVAPQLAIDVQVAHREQATRLVAAIFRRASDAEGRPRALLDSFLVVEDSSVLGVPTSPSILQYSWLELAPTLVPGDTITVRGPVVTGLPSSGLTVRVPVPVREDPFFRELVTGQDLLFTVSPLADSIDGLIPGATAFWIAEVRDARRDRVMLRIDGAGPHPSPLPIPWQLLLAAPDDSLSASLTFFSAHQVANSPYSVSVTIRGHFTWQVRIVAP